MLLGLFALTVVVYGNAEITPTGTTVTATKNEMFDRPKDCTKIEWVTVKDTPIPICVDHFRGNETGPVVSD